MTTWNYVVKADFVEQYGDKIAGQFVALMMRVGSSAAPGDIMAAQTKLLEGCEGLSVKLAHDELIALAQNLTAPEHDIVLFSEPSGTVIAEHRLRRSVVAA